MQNKDLYRILQVAPEASTEVITSAYRSLAEKYHPATPGGNPEKYQEITYAFEILCNPVSRKKYDDSRIPSFEEMLSPVYPVINRPKESIQNLINLLYENINYESVNHNPTKSRIYQEIYDEVIKERQKIETTEAIKNPLWKILKTYSSYLSEQEYKSLILIVSRILNTPEDEAYNILNKSDISGLPVNKLYLIISFFFIASILGVITAYVFLSKPLDRSWDINTDNNVETHEPFVPNAENTYFSRIINLGIPVNIRSAPTTEWNNIINKISPGEMVEVLTVKPNGWYKIKKDTIEGFIYGGLLENNDYPDSYPIAAIIPAEIKVFDKDHNVYTAFNDKDRLVVFFHDNEKYYLKDEKGTMIAINKDNVLLENPQKSFIPYIEDSVKDTVKYFAINSKQIVVEDLETNNEEEIDENNVIEDPEVIDYNNSLPAEEPTIELKPKEPVIMFPGQQPQPEESIDQYVSNLKTNILANWHVPNDMNNYSTVVVFRVLNNGQLEGVKLLQSSGSKLIDNASIYAVQTSAPFKPFPASYPVAYIDIQINFDEKF